MSTKHTHLSNLDRLTDGIESGVLVPHQRISSSSIVDFDGDLSILRDLLGLSIISILLINILILILS